MIIRACRIELRIPGDCSLKGKRSILKPLLARLRRECKLSASGVGFNDLWRRAEVALVTVVNNDSGYLQQSLEKVVGWVQKRLAGGSCGGLACRHVMRRQGWVVRLHSMLWVDASISEGRQDLRGSQLASDAGKSFAVSGGAR